MFVNRIFPAVFVFTLLVIFPAFSSCTTPANDSQVGVSGSFSLCTGAYSKVRFILNATGGTLDCNGSVIEGENASLNYKAVTLQSVSNTTVTGCTIRNYKWGYYASFSEFSNKDYITNNTFFNNTYGIDNLNNDYLNITYNNFTENGDGIVAKSAYYYFICGNRFVNQTLRAISFPTGSVRYSTISSNYFSRNRSTGYPEIDIDTQLTSSAISQNTFEQILGSGITISSSLVVSLTNITGNNFTDLNGSAMNLYGMRTANISGNSIIRTRDGISFSDSAQNNTIEGNNFSSGVGTSYGISAISLKDTVFRDNRFWNYTYPFVLYGSAGWNSFYNNFFNTSSSASNGNGTNSFNTTQNCSRTGISGGGCYGGNYWGRTNGNGFSDTCADGGEDGICDSIYNSSSVIDYIPLSNRTAGGAGDSTPPAILTADSSAGISSANITVETNESANLTLAWGTTIAFGNVSSSGSFSLSQTLSLAQLSPETAYYFNATSCDSSGNCARNGTFSFSTLTEPPAEPPVNITLNESAWGPGTTNFSQYNNSVLANISNVTFSNGHGKLVFAEPLNLSESRNLSGLIIVANNSIFINSSAIPEFNRSARITFLGANFSFPVVKRDGADCGGCADQSFNQAAEEFNVTVPFFSNYTLEEQCEDGVENYDEEGVDCGGTNCPTCPPATTTTTTSPPTTTSVSGGGGSGVFPGTTTSSTSTAPVSSSTTSIPSRITTTSPPKETTNSLPAFVNLSVLDDFAEELSTPQPLPLSRKFPFLQEIARFLVPGLLVCILAIAGIFLLRARALAVDEGRGAPEGSIPKEISEEVREVGRK
ncbi:MAG: NosD domain-containing protein [archaeon]